MFKWSKAARLYKSLLTQSAQIKYSDGSYYRHLIRTEFQRNKGLNHKEELAFQLDKGRFLLEQTRGKVI